MMSFVRSSQWLSTAILWVGLSSTSAYAGSIDHIRHVIFNDSAIGAYYELKGLDNAFCQAKGYLTPGEMKVVSCQSSTASSYGPYLLQSTPPGWWGSSMRDSKIYHVNKDAQVMWKLAYVLTDRGNILGISVSEEPI